MKKFPYVAPVLLLAACATSGLDETIETYYDGPTQTVCKYSTTNEDGIATVEYQPDDGSLTPIRVYWEASISDEKEGSTTLRAYWQSGTYSPTFSEQAQFHLIARPRKKGPDLVRLEFHPWAYSYVDWGMRYGEISERNDENEYFASARWATVLDLEAGAENEILQIWVQKIVPDTVNNNYAGYAIMRLELPPSTFRRADILISETIDKGNTLMQAGEVDCSQEPDPPIIVATKMNVL
jgi:hypothetical protein